MIRPKSIDAFVCFKLTSERAVKYFILVSLFCFMSFIYIELFKILLLEKISIEKFLTLTETIHFLQEDVNSPRLGCYCSFPVVFLFTRKDNIGRSWLLIKEVQFYVQLF